MRAMFAAFAATILIAVAAWLILGSMEFTTARITAAPTVRLP